MVPAGNALGVLSRKFHIPPLKISGIKNRCNAVDGAFYDAIKVFQRVIAPCLPKRK